MRQVKLKAKLKGRKAAEVFSILCDFERYPSLTEVVRSLTVLERNGDRMVSKWEVAFQDGLLRWTEEDDIDREKCVWRFRQIEGDVDHFAGEWGVRDEERGCSLWFSAEFEIGIPALDATLGPIAERGLRENMRMMVYGLLGESVEEID